MCPIFNSSSSSLLNLHSFIIIRSPYLSKFSLLLVKFAGHGVTSGVATATSSTSPLSARELVEISLLQEPEAEVDITAGNR